MRHIFLLSLCCLSSFYLLGQNSNFTTGQIYLRNGDIKTGLISDRFQHQKGVYLKNAEYARVDYYEMDQISAVKVGDENRYVPHYFKDSVTTTCLWLITLVESEVSLYRSPKDANKYYLEEGGTFFSINLQTLPGVVNALKNKCVAFKEKNGVYRLTPISLIEMAKDYNQCRNSQAAIKTYLDSRTKVYIGAQLGPNQGSTKINENLFYDRKYYFREGSHFRNFPTLTFGIPVDLQIGKHFSITGGAFYIQQIVRRDSNNLSLARTPKFSNIKFNVAFVEIPLGLQYRFININGYQPFVQVGFGGMISMLKSIKVDSRFPPEDIPPHSFRGVSVSRSVGVGVSKELSSNMKLQFFGQLTKFYVSFDNQFPIYNTNNLQLDQYRLTASLLWRFDKHNKLVLKK
jgi:hypothetical protein